MNEKQSAHTKGLLFSNAQFIRSSAGIIAEAVHTEDASAVANAARLVACWNFCDGEDDLPPGELRQLRDRHAKWHDEAQTLRAQRDELLAALLLVRDQIPASLDEAVRTISAAIAKAGAA